MRNVIMMSKKAIEIRVSKNIIALLQYSALWADSWGLRVKNAELDQSKLFQREKLKIKFELHGIKSLNSICICIYLLICINNCLSKFGYPFWQINVFFHIFSFIKFYYIIN
jgi:hypothetical protein